MDKKISCPYCDHAINVHEAVEDFVTFCPRCKKKYKTLFVRIKSVLERGSRSKEEKIQYRLRVLDSGNNERFFKFHTKNDIELRSGDHIGLFFKKKFFGDRFRYDPAAIMNYRVKLFMKV